MKIVGVTACPTGIAHTYMSAEKLEVTARNLNHQAKFETQGVKTENQLSEQEIKEADAIILAVDKEIELDRFAGKKVKRVSTSRAIKEPQVVIDEALRDIGVFVVSNEKEPAANEKKPTIYNHFMNGVNYMLPFVIAGGIIIALSFAFGITAADPNSADYNVLAAAFSRIGRRYSVCHDGSCVRRGDCYIDCWKSRFCPRNCCRITGLYRWFRFSWRNDWWRASRVYL